jgi:hypothetical protein
MIVQIAALGHPKKKVTKLQRILARRLEVGFGALLQTCLRAPGLRRFGLTRSRHGEDEQQSHNNERFEVVKNSRKIHSRVFHRGFLHEVAAQSDFCGGKL